MAVIQSVNGLVDLQPNWTATASYGSIRLYDRYNYTYGEMYRTQPAVRTCVDFLARNVAQLGLHVFRRVSETDRQRLRDHPLALLFAKPNPWTTTYRLIESLMADLGVYYNAYWLKTRQADGSPALVRIPPHIVDVYGDLAPTGYVLSFAMGQKTLPPDEVVHFSGYNPNNGAVGLSPLETLRRVLAEEAAAGEYREYFWRNAARMAGFVERPKDAPDWGEAERERFRQQFEVIYSGGANSGKTAILEDGMTWKPGTFSAQESEYIGGRKLSREEVGREYHIPLPMIGILDNANYANMTEAHKQLYQDCLGPWLAMIEDECELQLLPWAGDSDGVYIEFNIAEKLQGSFQEQIQAFQSAVGRPIMTADEARARLNLPSLGGDAARLVTPLNVLVGGQASPRDSAPDGAGKARELTTKALKAATIDPTLQQTRQRHIAKWVEVMSKFFTRQYNAIIGRVRDDAGMETVWIDGERWDTELSADLLRLNKATSTVWAQWMAEQLDYELDEVRMENYLKAISDNSARRINGATSAQIAEALLAEVPKDAVKNLFDIAGSSRSDEIAQSGVNGAANFGAHEGAQQGGLTTKTWQHNGGSIQQRDDHAAMDGETVGIGELFSNGMRWPGDPAGGAENNAHCNCSLTYGRE